MHQEPAPNAQTLLNWGNGEYTFAPASWSPDGTPTSITVYTTSGSPVAQEISIAQAMSQYGYGQVAPNPNNPTSGTGYIDPTKTLPVKQHSRSCPLEGELWRLWTNSR